MNITRKGFITTAAAAAGMGAFANIALASAAEAPTEVAANQGTFLGHGTGCKGPLELFVTIEDGVITGVYPGANEESQGPGSNAFAILGDRVVASQSINVDAVAGATFTSFGYKDALREAVEKAGMLEKFDVPYTAPAPDRSDESYDVVIVGAGGAGMMAAIALKYPDYDHNVSETSVLVLEKMDFPGGSTMLSSGGFAVNDGLRAHDAMDVHATADEMIAMCAQRSEQDVNEPLVRRIFDGAADTMTKIVEMGGPYTVSHTTRTRTFLDTTYL